MLTICVGYGVLGLLNLGNPFPEARKSLRRGRYRKQVLFRQIMHLVDGRYIYNFERWKRAWMLRKLAVLVVRLNC
jgi:hypothetical protein